MFRIKVVCFSIRVGAEQSRHERINLKRAAKDLAVNNFPILRRARLLDWQVSAAGQIFAPAKSAFMPSMAISRRRQAYTDVFTQPLNSIAHRSWLIVLLI